MKSTQSQTMPGRASRATERLPTLGLDAAARRCRAPLDGRARSAAGRQPPALNSCQIWWYSLSAVDRQLEQRQPVVEVALLTTAVARFSGT